MTNQLHIINKNIIYMKKGLLTLALVAGSLLGAQADDHLTALLKPGNAVLGIQLKNATEGTYTAFQMDVTLPDGMTLDVAEGADPATAITLLRGASTAGHKVFANVTDEGILKIVAFSASSYEEGATITDGNQPFTDVKGDMLLIKVNTEPTCKPSELIVDKIEYVKTTGLEATSLATTAVGKLGDTNGDDIVDTNDAIKVLNQYLGLETLSLEQFERGSVNGNETVDTNDAIKILNIYLGL